VAADAVLLVDHAEADAGIAAIEIDEQGGKRGPGRLDMCFTGVGVQRARNQHVHANSAASTA
jgi:hypothetical protein